MLLVALPDGQWARPVHGYPSSHILKVDDRRRPGLVHAEHTCLRLAQTAGLDAPDSHLIRVGDADCLVVRRFDRTTVAGEVTRVHQEDACQALGVDPEGQGRRAKYESFGGPSLRAVAQLLGAWAADSDTELLRLLDHLVFTVLIGNADAHGKNVALLHPRPGEIRLAPLYDTVPTVLWPQLRQDAAMSVAGRFRLPAITVDDVVREAAGWPLPAGAARERTVAVAETLRDSCGRLDASLDVRALEAIARRADDFLATAAV
jgi:serine/threonine-protein kinase HipA